MIDSKGTRAGPSRVYLKYAWQPGLATSRSFGDTMAKIVGVISEPEFEKHTLHATDEVIIVASDGVWEVVSTQVIKKVFNSVCHVFTGIKTSFCCCKISFDAHTPTTQG